jgi:hypothetical protein
MVINGIRPAKAWVAVTLTVSAPTGAGAKVARLGSEHAGRASSRRSGKRMRRV